MMHYIALGDSITIDDYPDQELGSKFNGAASLLHRKMEISSFFNLSEDGATIGDIRQHQVPAARRFVGNARDPMFITLTAGGNDISFGSIRLMQQDRLEHFSMMMGDITRKYCDLVLDIRQLFPNSHIVLNTLYDPTDGMGKLPENCGMWARIAPQYSRGRRELGQFIKGWGEKLPWASVADIFSAFDTRGMKIKNEEGYYYDNFLIEPGSVGAAVIADLWYEKYIAHIKPALAGV
jgi:hypothetical protein